MKKPIIIFVCLSIVASAINYLSYPVLGRILPSNQYVDITVALSLFTQITTFLSSINAVTIGLTKQSKQEPKEIVQELQSALFKIFLLLIATLLITSPIVLGTVGIPAEFGLPISILMIASLPLTIMSGFLNGKQLMVKLGFLTVISAGFQFLFGTVSAYIAHSGFVTMASMATAQVIAIIFIQWLYRRDNLPSALPSFRQKDHTESILSRRIIVYTALASVAIMFVNIIQISDLLLITNNSPGEAKFYTDLYIISRIVFFAGMIFIWPFLGEINVVNLTKNRRPFLKLFGIFAAIAVSMVIGLSIFGEQVVQILLGTKYDPGSISIIGSLSVLFKTFLLAVTAITLYFIVIRSYIAIYYALCVCISFLAYSILLPDTLSVQSTLSQLTLLSAMSVVIGIALFFYHAHRTSTQNQDTIL